MKSHRTYFYCEFVHWLFLFFIVGTLGLHAQSTDMLWYEAIQQTGGYECDKTPIHDMKKRSDGSIVLSFTTSSDMDWLSFLKNDVAFSSPILNKSYGVQLHIVCLSPESKLLWLQTIYYSPSTPNYYQPYSKLAILPNGSVTVLTYFSRWVSIGNDTLRTDDFDGVAGFSFSPVGKLTRLKQFTDTWHMNFEQLSVDSAGTLYAAGKYFQYSMNWDGINIRSNLSPSYFLAKIDSTLTTQWIRSFNMWNDNYGELTGLAYNTTNNTISLIISEGTYSTSSSCEYKKWRLGYHVWDTDGNQLFSGDIATSTDLMVGGSLAIDSYGNALVAGRYRGTLTSNELSVTSPPSAGCSLTNSFVLRLRADQTCMTLKTFPHSNLHSYQTIMATDHGGYCLGGVALFSESRDTWIGNPYPNGKIRTILSKYNYHDELLFYREFSKRYPDGDDGAERNYIQILPYTDSVMVVADMCEGKYDTLAMSPLGAANSNGYSTVNVFALRWNATPTVPKSESSNWRVGIENDGSGIWIYNAPTISSYSYSVYNILGQHISSGENLNANVTQRHQVDLREYPSAGYVLRVRSGSLVQEIPFVLVR